jgi:predicted nuclease with TOPRIM domain
VTGKKKTDSAKSNEESNLSIEEVQERLDEISNRLARLEELIERVGPGIEEVRSSAKVIREGFEFYDGMVRLMSKFTKAERLESRYGDLKKDDISWRIIQILDNSSRPLNISQITAAVRSERGTASRRIVRERVNELVGREILQVIEDEDDRARYFALVRE